MDRAGTRLELRDVPPPTPAAGQLLLSVRACGVCRTDLHVVDGELPHPKLPLVPGHEIVGDASRWATGHGSQPGTRVGVPWLGWTCGDCRYCRAGRENLCDERALHRLHVDGGYAEYAVADARFCFPIPAGYADVEAAPLLCAGLIGYRSLGWRATRERLGLYGFGAAAHIVAQVARHQGREVYAFTRPGDSRHRSSPAARRRLGGRLGRAAARGARRGDHLRAGRARSYRRRSRRSGRRHRRLRRHPHERHPGVSVRALGGAGLRSVANLTRQTARSSSLWRRPCRSIPRSRSSSWPTRTTPWAGCAEATCAGPP